MTTPSPTPTFATLLQDFFCERLQRQRGASPHTVAAYRDTFRLLLHHAEQALGRSPVQLALSDLDAALVLAFLEHLERDRGNEVRTRNARLAAIRSFCQYASRRAPTALAQLQQVLAIPFKRFDRRAVGYLSREEVDALLAAPPAFTWSGARDRVLFQLLYNTGARIAELIGLNIGDITFTETASVRFRGKGRKERSVPLWKTTRDSLRAWLRGRPADPVTPVFLEPSRRPPDPLGRTGSARRRHQEGERHLSFAVPASRHAPRASAHHRHAPASGGDRHHRHRAVAGSRESGHHPHVS
jgi:integrase/recombinase XerD